MLTTKTIKPATGGRTLTGMKNYCESQLNEKMKIEIIVTHSSGMSYYRDFVRLDEIPGILETTARRFAKKAFTLNKNLKQLKRQGVDAIEKLITNLHKN